MIYIYIYFFFSNLLPPAENTFVGTGQARRGLHTSMWFNPVEGVFIAASSPSQHWLTKKGQHWFHLYKEKLFLPGKIVLL